MGGDGGKSGISQYIINLLAALAAQPDGMEFEVVVYPDEQDIFIADPAKLTPLHVSGRIRNPVINIAWHQLALPGLCRRRGWDALFLPAANRRVAWSAPCPTIGVVHDLSGLHVAKKYDPARMFYIARVLPAFINRLDRVVSISSSTTSDITGHAGYPAQRIDLVPNGVDLDFYTPGDPDAARRAVSGKYGLDGPYIIYVSRLEHPGKNHVRLIKAFDRVKAARPGDLKLVLVGSDWNRAEEVHAAAGAAACRDDIVFTGFAPTADLPDLYRAAEVMIFPSLYEGFGMPILEAMACGVPVLAADASSLPEVAGDAAVLFDPHSAEAMAGAMLDLLTDEDKRLDLAARGIARAGKYTWAATAALIRRSIETAVRDS